MNKTECKAWETKYEHCLFYGYGINNVILQHNYTSLEGLAKTLAFNCLQEAGEEYNDLLEHNQHSLNVHHVLELVEKQADNGELSVEGVAALEDNNSTWPEIKKAIKKLFNQAGRPLGANLSAALAATDRSHQLASAGKSRYQVILAPRGRKGLTVKYFDEQAAALNYILKSKYKHGDIVIGDANIANFLKSKKYKELNKMKSGGSQAYSLIAKILENKWELTKSYKAFCDLAHGTEKGR